MGCCLPESRTLHVVLPYFNFCGFKRRRELFVKFVHEHACLPGVSITVVEALGPAPLPRLPVARHLRLKHASRVWLKETLINYAATKLPDNWEYLAWIDADISFLNKKWVKDAFRALADNDIVQLWHSAVNLGPSGDVVKVDKSFCYMLSGSGTSYTKTDRYGFWHPGYAWACTRAAWRKMGGLPDWAILGSGDRHLALALIGRAVESAPGNIHKNYKTLLSAYERFCKGLVVGWVQGTILHHWHGRLEDRKYRERWDILTRGNFDPYLDLAQDKNGLVALSKSGQRFIPELDEYFTGRREDDKNKNASVNNGKSSEGRILEPARRQAS